MAALILSILMLGIFALVAGGLYLLISGRDRRKGLLMLVAALVVAANIAILTL